MLSRIPLLEPVTKGVLAALFSVAAISLGGYFFFNSIPPASPDLLRALATIGATLVLAYIVETVWLVERIRRDEEFEEWLGFVTGAGIAGFLGVLFSLLLSEHRAAGHANFLDEIGLAWVFASLLILGGILVFHPLMAHWVTEGPAGPNDEPPSPSV